MKFEIFQSEKDQRFYFRLKAKNGQIILQSQGYSGQTSCLNGIESVRKNSQNPDCFSRKKTSNNKFHFNLHALNKQIVGSSQLYSTKAGMEGGIDAVGRVAPLATVEKV